MEMEADATQGLDDIALSDNNESNESEEEVEGGGMGVNSGAGGCNFDDDYAINGVEDIWKVNFKELFGEDIKKYHFPDAGVGFLFYNWYAAMNGFGARKSRYLRNKKGEITQQTFLCYREGVREERFDNTGTIRKRQPKAYIRCGCKAKCRVHVDASNGRWYIKYLNEVHNHTMVEDKFVGMLPAHRKISDDDVAMMNDMRNVGIRTPHIYGYLAGQAGGYRNVRFRKQDLYNEQEKQKRMFFSDATAGLNYLEGLRRNDDMMFFRHTVDEEGRLEHLFWCDGHSRGDYLIFGDVMAFDATYRKNKYLCPFVVFSGVNHHNQSIVFGAGLVTNEKEETYVWLLEQFLEAMGGKAPTSVITDGDMAMRNAIRKVFPDAHHRLCAWHLLRNAASNVHNPKFVSKFRDCMLGDYDIMEFNGKWDNMVAEFGLEENNWVRDLYEKRTMWATAYIRGNFFAGFRTTSRCEGLHSEFGKYANYQNNIHDFLKHFFRWLNYMRYKEVEADFVSVHGDPVMQTQFKSLESSASSVYTREIMTLFRPMLERASVVSVLCGMETPTSFIYTLSKYREEGRKWHVMYFPSTLQFNCSCKRLESFGIPCEHIVRVMVVLNIVQIPDCVLLNRWKKTAKDSIGIIDNDSDRSWDPSLVSQYVAVIDNCKRMAGPLVRCRRPQFVRNMIQWFTAQKDYYESVLRGEDGGRTEVPPPVNTKLKNPIRVRTKGCGAASTSGTGKGTRRSQSCGICGEEGHNRLGCPVHKKNNLASKTYVLDEQVEGIEEMDCANVDIGV